MKILVINAGSSSFKYQLIDMETKTPLCSGLVERINDYKDGKLVMGNLVYKRFPDTDKEEKIKIEKPFANHREGMLDVMAMLTSSDKGVIKDASEIFAAGHRVVMGGSLKDSLVDEEIKAVIREFSSLSPLHNPANLTGIEVLEELFPSLPSVVVFDTGFHSSMKEHVYTYAIPKELSEKYNLRRYGFHGTSHKYVSREAAKFLGKEPENCKLIVCHLGNGCSMSAVKNGKCIDTTMGLTPLEGLMMGTRSGDIDPALPLFLMKNENISPDDMDTLLNKSSGLKGVCGMNDMRDLHEARQKGNKDAELAFMMFVHKIRKYLGAYMLELDGIDGLIFTGGIGENDEFVRKAVTDNLSFVGIELDQEENLIRRSIARIISTKSSKIPVVIFPTNEELEIALTTQEILSK